MLNAACLLLLSAHETIYLRS
ncbi:hypothetical protein RSAG8_09463, partial [Rhizoctonia solani AG-8 WAC10335]